MCVAIALPAASGGQSESLLRPGHHLPCHRTHAAPCSSGGRVRSAVLLCGLRGLRGLRGGVAQDEVAERLESGLSAASRDNAADAARVEVNAEDAARVEANRAAKERERVQSAIRDTLACLEVMGAPEHKPGYFAEQFVSLLDAEGFPRTDIPVLEIQVPESHHPGDNPGVNRWFL